MPVIRCKEDGKPGYKWGNSGKCYTYTSGDKQSREDAKSKAEAQGRAAHASGYEGSSDTKWNELTGVLDNIGTSIKSEVEKRNKK